MTVTVTVLLTQARASRRCSASTSARVVGAMSLSATELRGMQSDLEGLRAALDGQRTRRAHADEPLSPPDQESELSCSAAHPNFGRLADTSSVEPLKGDVVQSPIVMPVQLSLVPDRVSSVVDVSNALQHATYLCTLLSNQHGLVRDSFALRIGLLTHLFVRVLPQPLPPDDVFPRAAQPAAATPAVPPWLLLGLPRRHAHLGRAGEHPSLAGADLPSLCRRLARRAARTLLRRRAHARLWRDRRPHRRRAAHPGRRRTHRPLPQLRRPPRGGRRQLLARHAPPRGRERSRPAAPAAVCRRTYAAARLLSRMRRRHST